MSTRLRVGGWPGRQRHSGSAFRPHPLLDEPVLVGPVGQRSPPGGKANAGRRDPSATRADLLAEIVAPQLELSARP